MSDCAGGRDFDQAMRDLLLATFPGDTIRDFIAPLRCGRELGIRLPNPPASPLMLARSAVELLGEFRAVDEALDALAAVRPNWRDAIVRVRALPRQADRRLAAPTFNPAPPFPRAYVEREALAGFCDAIRNGAELAGVTGAPGAGKTTFAAAAARSVPLGTTFARICWVALEHGSGRPVIDLQRQLFGQLSGGGVFEPADWRDGRARLVEAASAVLSPDERLLIVVDDAPDPLDRVAEALRVHAAVTLLLCSNNHAGLLALGARPLAEVHGLRPGECLELLAKWCECPPGDLPPAAAEISEAVGGLPLALAVVGAMVSLAGDRDAEWAALNREIRAGKVNHLNVPGLEDAGVLAVLGKSIAALGPSDREDLQMIALLPAGGWLEPERLARVWGAADADDAKRRGDRLAVRSLLRRDPRSRYALHRLLRLVLRALDDRLAERFRDVSRRYDAATPPLILALGWEDQDAFDALVSTADAAEVNRTTPRGVPAAHVAALRGRASATKALLDRGADPRLTAYDGSDALQCAAQGGDPRTLGILLGTPADPTRRNGGGKTALDVAARAGHVDAVRLLAAVPGAIRAAAHALGFAAFYDHREVVTALLAAGADPNVLPAENSPPLHVAAGKGRELIVEMLLKAGADPNLVYEDQTALLLAASAGHELVVDSLVGHGADVAWRTTTGRTILHQAAQSGRLEIVERLATSGPPVDDADGAGLTPLDVAATLGHGEVVKALVARGAAANRFGADQLTPLHRAVHGNHVGAVMELLAAGADPSARGQRGFSPLLLAVVAAPPSIVQENKMSMDERGFTGSSVTIYRPVSPDALRIIDELAAAGADVDAADDDGRTALHWAVLRRSPELTGALVALGADRTKQDLQGHTPGGLAAAGRLAELEGSLLSLRMSAVESLLGS